MEFGSQRNFSEISPEFDPTPRTFLCISEFDYVNREHNFHNSLGQTTGVNYYYYYYYYYYYQS